MIPAFSRGDVVSVRATVKHGYQPGDDKDFGIGVQIDGYYQTVFLPAEKLTLVHRHFEVGERVFSADDEAFGHVLAIHGNAAWVEREDNGQYLTLHLNVLERAPLPPAKTTEAA
jgi:hypothetical protein